MLALKLALALTIGAAEVPAVAVLPLEPTEAASQEFAEGIDKKLRDVIETYTFLSLLPLRSRDSRRVERCKGKLKCLGELAHRRGADLLTFGALGRAPGGFEVTLVVVRPKSSSPLREVTAQIGGDDAQLAFALDLLARRALAPEQVYATLEITGEPEGAEVLIDDALIGTLPLDEPAQRVVAGVRTVEVRKAGFDALRRRVKLDFQATEKVDLELSATANEVVLEDEGLPVVPVGLLAGGASAIVVGGILGTFSLLDAQEVERRAAAQQLAFPRDEALLARGTTLAVTSTVLYVVGLATTGAGAWLFFSGDDR